MNQISCQSRWNYLYFFVLIMFLVALVMAEDPNQAPSASDMSLISEIDLTPTDGECLACIAHGNQWCDHDIMTKQNTNGECINQTTTCSFPYRLITTSNACDLSHPALYTNCHDCTGNICMSCGYSYYWCAPTDAYSNTSFCGLYNSSCLPAYAINKTSNCNPYHFPNCATCLGAGQRWCTDQSSAVNGYCQYYGVSCDPSETSFRGNKCPSDIVGKWLGMSLAIFVVLVVLLPCVVFLVIGFLLCYCCRKKKKSQVNTRYVSLSD